MKNNNRYLGSIYIALLILSLLPWIWIQFHQVLNGNILYLAMTSDIFIRTWNFDIIGYDVNPPFNALIYTPAALLTQITTLPLYTSVFIYVFIALVLCSLVFYALLRETKLSFHQKLILVGTYIIANSCGSQFFFAEREYFIALTLPLLALAQLGITRGDIAAPIKHIALILGSFFIMLKPFFYIAPACIILHRLITQKRISVLWDSDSLYLTIFAIIYLALSFAMFDHYFLSTLPNIVKLYLTSSPPNILAFTLCALFMGIMLLGLSLWRAKSGAQPFYILFFAMFALCLFPYLIQGKGYIYHLAPAALFLFLGFALGIYSILSHHLSQRDLNEKNAKHVSLIMTSAILILFSYKFVLLPNLGFSHEEYKDKALVELVQQGKEENCSFFMFHDTMEIIYQISAYSSCEHASRFPTFWFLPALLEQDNPQLTGKEKKEIIQKYAAMTAEDLERFQPDTLILGDFKIDGQNNFDFIRFFSEQNKTFARLITNYEYDSTRKISIYNYLKDEGFKGDHVAYDIYHRKHQKR